MRFARAILGVLLLATPALAAEPHFVVQDLSVELGVGYAVRLADVDADGKLDIVIADQKRVIWLQNPSWKVREMIGEGATKPDNVCLAPADIDGDGRLDFALGADWRPGQPGFTTEGGTVQWLRQPKSLDEPWTVHAIGSEPSTHRMNFADLDGDGRLELINAPLQGRGTAGPKWEGNGVRILASSIPKDPLAGPWEAKPLLDSLHVVHNFQMVDLDGDKRLEMIVVAFEGVFLAEPKAGPFAPWKLTKIGEGDQKSTPNRGASEIKLGRVGGKRCIATIEPWHGDKVVVYVEPEGSRPASGDWPWTRHVVDAELKWGHAVWFANLDDDADDELIIGARDNVDEKSPEGRHRRGVRTYDAVDAVAGKWNRTLIDAGGVSVEDLAAADLDGDGRQDVVAVGRFTHNAKIYWNRAKP